MSDYGGGTFSIYLKKTLNPVRYSAGNSNARGVLTVFNSNLFDRLLKFHGDIDGRSTWIAGTYEGVNEMKSMRLTMELTGSFTRLSLKILRNTKILLT